MPANSRLDLIQGTGLNISIGATMNGAGTIWNSQVRITGGKELNGIKAKVFLPTFMKVNLLVVITLVSVVKEGQTEERRSFGRF